MATTSSLPVWKGKDKATEFDYDDLNPTITYRHLFSHNLGVKDPLRVIALCDSDAFYAACEQVRLGIDPALPLVVQQWDSLIAVNYPARKFGISRMDKIKDARNRCPELVVVHVATYKEGEKEPGYWENPDTLTHKVSLDHYRRESMKIIQMFKDGLPDGEIEKASIDEAFIDFTQPVRAQILKRYSYLATVPPDAPNGPDTPLPPAPPISWNGLGTLIPVYPDIDCADGSGQLQPDGKASDNDGHSTTWHDIALSIAAELMEKIRADIYAKLGYSTSAGISRNKFLAKLTASYKKPNSQSILRNAAIPNYLRPMAFQKIRFLGGKLGDALAKEYDVSTVGDLLSVSLDEMQRKFGENSLWVYQIIRGVDRSEVKEKSAVNKSMLASKNLPQPITKASQGHHWIRVLAAELALRLHEAREAQPALWPKSVVLHVRQGYDSSRSKQTAFPFVRNATVDVIAAAGDKLWKELVGTEATRATPMKINSVQLSFSGIETMETGQRNIEGFFKPRSLSDGQQHWELQQRKRDENDATLIATEMDERRAELMVDGMSFTCPRCGKQVTLPEAFNFTGDGGEGDIKKEALATLKMEHDDFHLAQDLSKTPDNDGLTIRPIERLGPVPSPQKKRRRIAQSETEGIAKFFFKR